MLALRTRGPSRNAPNLQTSIFGTPEMTQVNWFGEGARARLPERLCHVLPARAVDAECVRRASGRFGPRAPQGRGDLRYGEADLRSPAIAASGVCPTPPTAATVVRGGGRAASTERMGTPPTARNWKGEKTALTVEPPPSVPPPTSRVGARSTMRGETPASSGDPGGGGRADGSTLHGPGQSSGREPLNLTHGGANRGARREPSVENGRGRAVRPLFQRSAIPGGRRRPLNLQRSALLPGRRPPRVGKIRADLAYIGPLSLDTVHFLCVSWRHIGPDSARSGGGFGESCPRHTRPGIGEIERCWPIASRGRPQRWPEARPNQRGDVGQTRGGGHRMPHPSSSALAVGRPRDQGRSPQWPASPSEQRAP